MLLLDFVRGVSGVASSNGGDTATPPSWNGADLARAIGRHPKDRTVREVVKRLADRGVIFRNGDGRWAPAPTLFDDEDGADD